LLLALSNAIVTEEEKNFLVTLPRHFHLLTVSSRRRSFASLVLSDKNPLLLQLVFLFLFEGLRLVAVKKNPFLHSKDD